MYLPTVTVSVSRFCAKTVPFLKWRCCVKVAEGYIIGKMLEIKLVRLKKKTLKELWLLFSIAIEYSLDIFWAILKSLSKYLRLSIKLKAP